MAELEITFDSVRNHTIQNFKMLDKKIFKIPGTDRYNDTALENKVRWETRYYGIRADGSTIKRAFVSIDDKIYMGSDVDKTLTEVYSGLSQKGIPDEVTMQVAGNSRMYFFNGNDTPIYYEGNDGGVFQTSTIEYKFAGGLVHDQRLWAFEEGSSRLYFSRVNRPENFTATYGGNLLIGNEKDSVIRQVLKLGRNIYVFKNNGIFRIEGTTQTTYHPVEVVPNIGVVSQKGACHVQSAIVFASQQDKEVYQFNGSPTLQRLTHHLFSFSDRLDETKSSDICCVEDTRNKLFRLAYKHKNADTPYNNNEICFSTEETDSGVPKWFDTVGARISCYDMWDREGDHTLTTGRSDTGLLMYHNRGYDWDDVAMRCIARTDIITPKKGYNSLFDAVFVKGLPSIGTFTLNTYLNSRIRIDGTKDTHSINDVGETTGIEDLTMSVQHKFNNYQPLLTGYNLGESISLEIYDETLTKEIMIENMVLFYTQRDRVLNNLVG